MFPSSAERKVLRFDGRRARIAERPKKLLTPNETRGRLRADVRHGVVPPRGRCRYTGSLNSYRRVLISVQAISWVLEQSKSSGSARLVLISIANHASIDGDSCWPAVRTIAREAHISERAVQYALPQLEHLQELKIIRGTGRKHTHRYFMIGYQKWVQDVHPYSERVQTVQRKGERIAPEPSLNRHKSKPSKPAQPRRGAHSPEKIRQIEAKQKRLQVEEEVARELYIGAGPCSVPGLMDQIKELGKRKSL